MLNTGMIAWVACGLGTFTVVYSASRPWKHHPTFQVLFAVVLVLVGPLVLFLVLVPTAVVQSKAAAIRAWLDATGL